MVHKQYYKTVSVNNFLPLLSLTVLQKPSGSCLDCESAAAAAAASGERVVVVVVLLLLLLLLPPLLHLKQGGGQRLANQRFI